MNRSDKKPRDPAIAPPGSQATAFAQTAADLDWNSTLKSYMMGLAGMVPSIGPMVAAMVDILWPGNEDVWAEIEAEIEALVDQKIAEHVWDEVQTELNGLKDLLSLYLVRVRNFSESDPQLVSDAWQDTQDQFVKAKSAFQAPGYEFLLLPVFVQFANLHLALLRDGVIAGASQWGWSQERYNLVTNGLTDRIETYSEYVDAVYGEEHSTVVSGAPSNSTKTQPFDTVNLFVREMTLTVLDYRNMWPYLDAAMYPGPVEIYLTREIYSDLIGTSDDSPLTLPAEPPTQPISQVTVWAWDRLDAIKVDYPTGGGPDGETTTGRMGNSDGGSSAPPEGGSFDLAATGQIRRVTCRYGSVPEALRFKFVDGSSSNEMGGRAGSGSKEALLEFGYEILSSIKVMGVSNYYGSANGAVFGFKFENGGHITPDLPTLKQIYMVTPQPLKAETLAAALPAADPSDVEEHVLKGNWNEARESFWSRIEGWARGAETAT